MRRLSSVTLLLTLLGVLAVTPAGPRGAATAAEGDPDDYCTHAPDRPFGWQFSDACRGHDECLDALDRDTDRRARLACDDTFLEALLEAPSAFSERLCAESVVCRLLARIYHSVVRLVTLRFVPDARTSEAPTGLTGRVDAYNLSVIEGPHFRPAG